MVPLLVDGARQPTTMTEEARMGGFLNLDNGSIRRIICVCVNRARRCVKTIVAQTIRAYYDNSCGLHELFAPCEKHINKYGMKRHTIA